MVSLARTDACKPNNPRSIQSTYSSWDWQGLEIVTEIMKEVWQDLMLDFMGIFISYTVAKGLPIWNWVGGLIAEGIRVNFNMHCSCRNSLRQPVVPPTMLASGLANRVKLSVV